MSPEIEKASEDASAQAVGLVALYLAGTIGLPRFRELLVTVLYAAKVAAAVLAEALLLRDVDLDPLGIGPGEPTRDALVKAVATVTEGLPEVMPESPPEAVLETPTIEFWTGIERRAQRLAIDAPRESARQTTRARLERAGVTHWKWVAQASACDECAERDGQTFPISEAMRDHPECSCDLEPADPKETQS